ncbi:hypothetical protein CHLNCDRAFT_54198 [Chlorella variabilis]|uniref:Vacuolar protein sorting-associated protein 35 n=1 Tax=Chlorella variabilis TaxID=554065 RepID=E1ZMY1_CHLVA|nr:hypothetical protein CHLNCDRAFT_54198 [Chlorella variabilis]EFN52770.1 hypothetical protein CHLNCDRAFT_54198 [Chlorella variabilis]|eukprot:XP_005844872.1 hypothetical protein CHLNCDRAFT_54198 [Chlorella variabilis]
MVEPTYLPEEQKAWLKDASNAVKRHGFYLRKAIDDDNMKEALRYSAALLGELRTSLLSLSAAWFDGLPQIFFRDESGKGRSQADLYDLVQHAGNIVPRLYLLCTAGACYIRGGEAPAKLILRDVVEMCKGVQHPTRGLFLRAYLVQARAPWQAGGGVSCVGCCRIPGRSMKEKAKGGNVIDAIEFLLVNFTEMNKLWVRMQHQGSARDRERRERERQQLADLVGKNLTYLSQLDGLTFPLYKDIVLPRVLEQVVSCRDDIAQQYLMQCIIMVFPDEFHLGSLQSLLGAMPQLQPGVRVHIVLSLLMDRLANYASGDKEVVEEMNMVDAFGQLSVVALKVVEQHPDMPGADVAAMYSALLGFSGTVYPDKLDFVDRVLQTCHNALQRRGPITDGKAEKQVVALLSTPLDKYDAVTVLGLAHYPSVMELLQPRMKREMATKIVQTLLKSGTKVSTVGQDIAEDQQLLARLVHNMQALEGDADGQYDMLVATQAFILYEESIPDSRQEVRALQSIMGTLNRQVVAAWHSMVCYVFGGDERAALAHKASSYCAKLLKRTDQCQAVLACSHLYWQPQVEGKQAVQDEQGVLSCLKRALKIANAAQQQLAVAGKPARGADASAGPAAASSLFVEILNHYLYFFDQGCQLITTASLLELVANEMAADACKDNEALQVFYINTLAHIKQQKAKGGEASAKYDGLQLAAGEYEESHITKPPRKSLNMPFAVGQEDGAAFVAQMCGDGVQGSAEAAALLEAAGYSGVAQMEGGYVGYTQVWSPSGKRRPPAGRWVSTGKEALKSGLDLRDVAMAYEEGGNMKVARYAEGLPPGESL